MTNPGQARETRARPPKQHNSNTLDNRQVGNAPGEPTAEANPEGRRTPNTRDQGEKGRSGTNERSHGQAKRNPNTRGNAQTRTPKRKGQTAGRGSVPKPSAPKRKDANEADREAPDRPKIPEARRPRNQPKRSGGSNASTQEDPETAIGLFYRIFERCTWHKVGMAIAVMVTVALVFALIIGVFAAFVAVTRTDTAVMHTMATLTQNTATKWVFFGGVPATSVLVWLRRRQKT